MASAITSPAIIHRGAGVFSKIPEEAGRLGDRALIVTGGHMHGSGRLLRLINLIEDLGVDTFVSEPIASEPTVDMIDELAVFAKQHGCDVVIAIGGGSVMDAAKAAALMITNPGKTEDYQLKRRNIEAAPVAQVFAPTTSGTGSEATRVSVLTNTDIGVKRSISDPRMTPEVVVLDPQLTASCDKYLTTITAMDAFAHAIESAVSTKSNAYTRHIALAAIEQLSAGLPRCQSDPDDLDARLQCQTGACFAGLAMQEGLGASHSLAPAACIVGDIRHSEAVGALLPHVIRLNLRENPGVYDQVKRAMDCTDVAGCLEKWCSEGGFANSLSVLGLEPSDWPEVKEVMGRYASHRQTNPVEVTDDYARELFELSIS